MKFLKYLFFIGLGAGLFFMWTKWDSGFNFLSKNKSVDSEVLLTNIQNVCKMVTVEGEFNNLIDHKDFMGFDWPILRKKAILKVNAKVSAGYDMEQLRFTIDQSDRTISITNFPKATILSVEPDIQYYDLQQGFFNSFTEEELTDLNKMAKDLITLKAYNSELLLRAEKQAFETLDLIRLMANTGGWKVVYNQEYEMTDDIHIEHHSDH